jgi:restriction endonuclease S subunit
MCNTIYRIKDLCNCVKGKTSIQKAEAGDYPLVVTAEKRLSSEDYQFDCEAVCVPLVSSTGHGHASLKRIHYQSGKFALGSILCALTSKNEDKLLTKYLYIYLSHNKDRLIVPLMKGSANVSLSTSSLENLKINIPDISVQRKIVSKYNLVESNIDEFKHYNNTYKEKINQVKINLIKSYFDEDKLLRIGDIFTIEKGSLQSSKCKEGDYNFITASAEWKTHQEYTHECEALVYAVGAEGSLGRCHYVNDKFIASDLCFILTSKKDLDYKLYKNIFDILKEEIVKNTATGTSKKAINQTNFSNYKIPYLTQEEQINLSVTINKINEIEYKITAIENTTELLLNSYIMKLLNQYNIEKIED